LPEIAENEERRWGWWWFVWDRKTVRKKGELLRGRACERKKIEN